MAIKVIGLDIAKSVLLVHGLMRQGKLSYGGSFEAAAM
jgi:hypothetical protein